MRSESVLLSAIVGACALCASSAPRADSSSAGDGDRGLYQGGHPIPEEYEGRFCYIEAAHTHTYLPEESTLEDFELLEAEGRYHLIFVGDPSEFGYEGPMIAYFGPHPRHFESRPPAADDCESDEAHFHLRAPASPDAYVDREGTYYFGSYEESRRAARKLRRKSKRARKNRQARRARKARRAERKRERERARRSRSARPASVAATSKTQPATPATKKPAAKSTKRKPRNRAFRSWMNKRLGR